MTDNDPFDNPASGKFEAKNHNGRLLLITPKDYLTGVKTINGEKDCIDGEVVVLPEPGKGELEVIDNARLFGGQLIAATKSKIGKMVLGRLGQGTAKPGQNAPWILTDPTDDDRAVGMAYLATKAPQL